MKILLIYFLRAHLACFWSLDLRTLLIWTCYTAPSIKNGAFGLLLLICEGPRCIFGLNPDYYERQRLSICTTGYHGLPWLL